MKPLARYAALNNFVELGHSLGLDPARLMRDAGLDPASIGLQDRWIPAEAAVEVLERAAAAADRDDIGLALAQFRRLSHLGPLSLVLREEPDVRSALMLLIRHQHMYNEALRIRLSEQSGIATVRVALDLGHPGQFRQSTDLGVGVLHLLIQGFIAPGWRPLSVAFAHPPPRDLQLCHSLFGPQVRFDADFNGISLYSKDLDTPNAMADPTMRQYTQDLLADFEPAGAPSTERRVRELVELLLPTGRCSVEQVARSLGVDRRTVHRRLDDEGTSFSAILDDTRAELAQHMVTSRRQSMIAIGESLGFSSPGNFSRWFRKRFGQSPTQWRAATHLISVYENPPQSSQSSTEAAVQLCCMLPRGSPVKGS
ncbi:helix-turn-helix domain-containing protein [Gordonia sp. HNM0687]|uniref:Helix-turn-helix domain-containing protein n=1 Tax=Gordonia mangrovi TaxID=2665643 RepID=A0A6L7GQ16_9ACTN|nr:AraC family transcriptional regulator [Gordonia mangrovi]MXP21447.1 helix-turn-helix domain-containing protein [Gordonia mangrovi]UVF80194.1 AraC family transcriptional regulator [Gordonia mangrovi]